MARRIQINLTEVRNAAARGLNDKQIAMALDISEDTLQRRKKDDKAFREAIEAGRAKGELVIANKLFERAKAGDFPCMAFYLERKCGWVRPATKVDHSSTDGSMTPKGPVLQLTVQHEAENEFSHGGSAGE